MRRAPGHGAPSSHAHGPPVLGPGQVSNVTNSNDFISKDSRVFVGNLNTFALSKEDVDGIFRRYGIVTGISMHKGYAFVQFTHPGDARRAVGFEDGQVYAGQPLGKRCSISGFRVILYTSCTPPTHVGSLGLYLGGVSLCYFSWFHKILLIIKWW